MYNIFLRCLFHSHVVWFSFQNILLNCLLAFKITGSVVNMKHQFHFILFEAYNVRSLASSAFSGISISNISMYIYTKCRFTKAYSDLPRLICGQGVTHLPGRTVSTSTEIIGSWYHGAENSCIDEQRDGTVSTGITCKDIYNIFPVSIISEVLET